MNKSSDIGEKKKSISNIEMDRRTFLKAVGILGAATLTGAYTTDIVKALENLDGNGKQIYVLAAPPNQGKTTTALLLENYFKSQGLKVACLQKMKGQHDVGSYLKNGCHHYTIPIEATKSNEILEQWIPQGYDRYILEVTFPYNPIGAAYVELFDNINEVVSYEYKDNWKSHVQENNSASVTFWDRVNKRNVQRIITKTPSEVTKTSSKIDSPCVDTSLNLHNLDGLVFDTINPKMSLPKSDKNVIAVGTFPGEFWDIFPNLKWYSYEYPEFLKDYRNGQYDLAIIGSILNKNLKLKYKPEKTPVICYQPSCYLENKSKSKDSCVKSDVEEVFLKIKKNAVGTSIGEKGCNYEAYNNRFWVPPNDTWWSGQVNSDMEILAQEDNMVYCNGWILPQYLIKEGMLEV